MGSKALAEQTHCPVGAGGSGPRGWRGRHSQRHSASPGTPREWARRGLFRLWAWALPPASALGWAFHRTQPGSVTARGLPGPTATTELRQQASSAVLLPAPRPGGAGVFTAEQERASCPGPWALAAPVPAPGAPPILPALTGCTFPPLHLARGWPSCVHRQFFYNEPQRWVSGANELLAAAGLSGPHLIL